MKILFISDNAINGFGGGSIENRKHYDALKKYCEKYGDELKVISRDKDIEGSLGIQIQKNRLIDVLVRIQGHSTYLYATWKKNEKAIYAYKPDMIYLGRSRFGFIAQSIKRKLPTCKVITNIDNVEVDYIDGYFSLKRGFINKLYRSLEMQAVKCDEFQAIEFSDALVYLTKRNVLRIKEIYGHTEQMPVVLPICLEEEIQLTKTSKRRTVVFIGSLDYAANVLAVQRILGLWKKHNLEKENVELLIAGRNPSKRLVEDINKLENIQLVQNFESASSIIPQNSLMLAPIEKGAGMKVKVAETLSMGLMIAASDEALVGYEEALQEDGGNGIIRANTDAEFLECIKSYLSKTNTDLKKIEIDNKKLFRKYYNYETSRKAVEDICNSLLKR